MEDKTEDLLTQYEITTSSVRKARGGLLLETPDGPYLLCRTEYGEGRLLRENGIKKALVKRGYELVDVFLENRQGNLITRNMYGEAFVVKKCFLGEECNLRSRTDIRKAAENLGRLHQYLSGIEQEMEEGEEKQERALYGREKNTESLLESFERKNRELAHLYRYITNKKKKNNFELRYIKIYHCFQEDCERACENVRNEVYTSLCEKAKGCGQMLHGSYNQHKVLFMKNAAATIDFSKAQTGIPVMDVYHFLRKMMEKNNWNLSFARDFLAAYQKERAFWPGEEEILRILLLYPEKFWKVANYYNNTRKTWISERTEKKLEEVMVQFPKRKKFLSEL